MGQAVQGSNSESVKAQFKKCLLFKLREELAPPDTLCTIVYYSDSIPCVPKVIKAFNRSNAFIRKFLIECFIFIVKKVSCKKSFFLSMAHGDIFKGGSKWIKKENFKLKP